MMRWIVFALAVLVGCTTVVKDTGRPLDDPRKPTDGPAVALPTDHPATVEEIFGADPCETRLRDIEAEIILYMSSRKHLPATLDELKPYQPQGHKFEYVCPASGKPYEYYPTGRMVMGRVNRIILADPEPTHGGVRWCIFRPNVTPGMAESLDVLPLPEAEFRKYTPVQ